MLKIFGLVIMSEREYDRLFDRIITSTYNNIFKIQNQRNDNRDPKTGRFVKRGE